MIVDETPVGSLRGESALAAGEKLVTHDLIWRHADGRNIAWHMVGPELHDIGHLATVADRNWALQAIADFDGDGRADLVWRHALTNHTLLWLMDGDSIKSMSTVWPTVDANWQIGAAADLDRDGRADLVWRNRTTGANFVWYMNGSQLREAQALVSVADLGWKLAGAGDLDGDDRPELVFRHDDGRTLAWFLGDRGTIRLTAPIGTPIGAPWSLEAVADIDTDGRADLVWRNAASGQIVVWFLNGEQVDSQARLDPPVADLGWRIVGARRRALSGYAVAARAGTPSYARGIRRWVMVPGERGARTHVVGVDDRGPRVFTSLIVPATYADDTKLSTQELISRYGMRPMITTRFEGMPNADRTLFLGDMKRDIAGPIPSPRLDGGPSRDAWDNCDEAAWTVFSDLLSVGVSIGTCVGTFLGCGAFIPPPFTAICMSTTTLPACIDAIGDVCSFNSSMADASCCQGGDQEKWPLPVSCFPTTTPAVCTCQKKYPGTHLEQRPRGGRSIGWIAREYRCASSSYKILVESDLTTAGFWADGGSCRNLPGFGVYTWEKKRGYREIDTGNWDDEPTIEAGAEETGPICGAAQTYTPGIVYGTRTGVSVAQKVNFHAKSLISWENSRGENKATRIDSRIVCKGWDWGSDSVFRKCVDKIKAARGGTLDDQPLEGSKCVSAPCDSVGWYDVGKR
jgi:hypothetical protein